jgi:hypothetical protein
MEDNSLASIKNMLTQISNKQNDMDYMLREMEKTLTQLNQTVIGNPTYGQVGLVTEINDIKKYVDRDKMLKSKIYGGLAVIGVVTSVVCQYIFNIFKK